MLRFAPLCSARKLNGAAGRRPRGRAHSATVQTSSTPCRRPAPAKLVTALLAITRTSVQTPPTQGTAAGAGHTGIVWEGDADTGDDLDPTTEEKVSGK